MKHLNNEKGATSVLVIFMMIVLVILGTFAITSAMVNFKFAKTSSKWIESYYNLESKAVMFEKDVYDILSKSYKDSLEKNDNILNKNELNNLLSKDAKQNLIANLSKYENYRLEDVEDVGLGDFYIYCDFKSEDNENSNFTVKLLVNYPDKYNEGLKPIYDVLEWRQWQTPVELDLEDNLWQP